MTGQKKEQPIRYIQWGQFRYNKMASQDLAPADDRIASALETFFKVNGNSIVPTERGR
jgi:hypothetical protein